MRCVVLVAARGTVRGCEEGAVRGSGERARVSAPSLYLCFRSNGSDSSEVHPMAGIHWAT